MAGTSESSDHQGLYFIVGASVVVVGVIAFLWSGGHLSGVGGGGGTTTEKTTATIPRVGSSTTTTTQQR